MTTNRSPLDPDDPLAVLRREMSGLDTPPEVEQALLAAFARQHAPQPWHRRLRQWLSGVLSRARLAQGGGAIAVMLLVAVGVFRTGGDPHEAVRMAGAGQFIALESLERIAEEPAPRMVETQVPRIVLAALGVAVTARNADEQVRAEMLVAADGHPLALRLTAMN